MRLATLVADSSIVGPSSEYSDSLDTTISIGIPNEFDTQSYGGDSDYHPSGDECNCGEMKIRSMKNVSIDPSPRYFGDEYEHEHEHGEVNRKKLLRQNSNKSISENFFGESNVDSKPKLIGNFKKNRRIKDLELSENSCFNQMPQDIIRGNNEVRRVASSDSIPFGTIKQDNTIKHSRVLSQDCVRRVKSPDVRQLRYIQSGKGTWSYNL